MTDEQLRQIDGRLRQIVAMLGVLVALEVRDTSISQQLRDETEKSVDIIINSMDDAP